MSNEAARQNPPPSSYFCEHTDDARRVCSNEAKQTRRGRSMVSPRMLTWNLCPGHALEHDTETSHGREPYYGHAV